ncbi:aquaporin-9b isoform X2 [Dunckerocampus dactyliophorus]|uniref:aquaporin-9b isoform X2 n=1 Tax=Dunckerocampus dactyliophorus TaxID=161453 RepID=UPI0024073C2C|nr:aquaporin-9b isoform X2 [Dunckerocampus dactyliophorus]
MDSECRRKWKVRLALKRDIFKEFLAEFLGIFVLILFGCGSVAQAVLSKGALGEPLSIHLGFTLGLMMAAYIAGGVSDALMDYSKGEFIVTGDNATAGIFASYPAKHLSILNGFLDQVVGAAALILCILAITDSKNIGAPRGMEPLCIGLVIMAIAVSMGLNCGYPINPARDLSPRLFTAVAGWGGDVFRAGGCWWWIPVFGPMVGGVVGAAIYFLFIELHHADAQKQEENNVQQKYDIVTLT